MDKSQRPIHRADLPPTDRELHRRGNERAWWEKQEIDPLPDATNLWAKTHETASPANPAAHTNFPVNFNGKHVGAAVRIQNDKTKPIFRPEAE
jgi:hypothetical protein